MKTQKVIVVGAILLVALLGAGITPVIADTSDVTTRWIVPADTTITISYPNSESLIEFNAVGMNFTDLDASSQTGALSALRVTNNGNTAVKLEFNWTEDWPTNITHVNISMTAWDDNTTYGTDWVSFGSANETTKQQVDANLGEGSAENFWFWTTGANVAETAGVDRSLRVTSTNV